MNLFEGNLTFDHTYTINRCHFKGK